MDPGRYGVQQGWDNNSALEGYGAAHDPNFGSNDDTRFLNDKFSGGNNYQRNAYPRDALERENYAPPLSSSGFWPNSRKRSHEEEYPHKRGSRRHDKPYADNYNDVDTYRDREFANFEGHDKHRDGYRSVDNHHDHGYDRPTRVGGRNHDNYSYDDHDHGHGNCNPLQHREGSREKDHGYDRHSFDSDYDRSGRREGPSRTRDYRDHEHDKRTSSRERDHSPHGRYRQSHSRSRSRSRSPSRSRSYGRDDHLRSRSPHGRSRSHSYREDSYDDGWLERSDRQRDRDEKRPREAYVVAPSATVVVKGLSQKTTEEDLYQILAEWGPLRHVRVIKERMSGLSRGFAFIDFPSVGSAKAMMDQIGVDGLVVDGRKIFFEYSSKPTGSGGAFTQENFVKSGHGSHKSMMVPSDWMCIICSCVNFARRTSCFQCNEPRGDDAPAADMISSSQASLGRRGLEAGPTHVLVVRGLDENADEEMLRYEFSKHAPIKDLRLVRDKFTHVSRGFAFVHFHSVEKATKALEATNGTALEKNGQILRVAYAKSVLGLGSGASSSSQSSRLAAAAIEAAAFSQQYDAVGWAPKEYNPEGKEADSSGQGIGDGSHLVQKDGSAPQSGFVWDEASGYYYDASSGFYYDGNTGLYYDGNNAIWYSFDHETQQYIPCNDQSESKQSKPSKGSDTSTNKKVVISAPAATITSSVKASSLPDAVQAAAAAAIAAEKKEKEKMKEIKLASKSSILANKKKMNNVLTMWKQRSHEGGQATRIALDETTQLSTPSTEDKTFAASQLNKIRPKAELTPNRDLNAPSTFQTATSDSAPQSRTIGGNTTGGTLMGVIRGSSGRGVVKLTETSYSASSTAATASSTLGNVDIPAATTPFKTDVSALGVYSTSAAVSGKRRFSETPLSSASASNHREQTPQSGYRDRAAERRSLYGSSSGADDLSDLHQANSNREPGLKKDSMPFPPGVGGGRAPGDCSSNAGPSYDVITADKAIDESNVGNRMLRNMGWQEGLGLGKDGSGMIEPVQAQAVDSRAGLGSQQKKKVTDPSLEVQAGDSYRTLIHKKALARFRDMA